MAQSSEKDEEERRGKRDSWCALDFPSSPSKPVGIACRAHPVDHCLNRKNPSRQVPVRIRQHRGNAAIFGDRT